MRIENEAAVARFKERAPELIARRIVEAERVGDVCGFDGLQETVPEIRDDYLREVEARKEIKENCKNLTGEELVLYFIKNL